MRSKSASWVSLVFFLTAILGVGFLGSLSTRQSIQDWYLLLQKPAGTPPNWVFAPVWTLLYILMSISVWRIWRLRDEKYVKSGLIFFFVQFLLNAVWSPVFFGHHAPGPALVIICLMWPAILLTILAFQKLEKAAACLLFPYLGWVTYATYLNAGIWFLNR